MILYRLGSKASMVDDIIPLFPPHEVYVEMFFGSGSIFFSKGKAKYNVLNDLDGEIINLFKMIKDRPAELIECIELTPFSDDVLWFFRHQEQYDSIWKAVKFLYLSNYTMMSKGDTLKAKPNNYKDLILEELVDTAKYLASGNIIWLNKDYKAVYNAMSASHFTDRIFTYADPPYVGTCNTYGKRRNGNFKKSIWTVDDLRELIEYLDSSNGKYAISEFAGDEVLRVAEEKGLEINYLKKRWNLKHYREEILLTNYKINTLF